MQKEKYAGVKTRMTYFEKASASHHKKRLHDNVFAAGSTAECLMTQETAMCNYTKKRDAGMREEISAHLSPRRIAGYNVKKLKTRTLTFIYTKR